MLPYPRLERSEYEGIGYYSDPALYECGVALCFTERAGGVSESPYASLNLGAHVGDDPVAVAKNRWHVVEVLAHAAFASSVSLPTDSSVSLLEVDDLAAALCVPNQTHGEHISLVEVDTCSSDLVSTDSLIVVEPHKPIMLCFADCVPVTLVAPAASNSGPAVAIAHAGWKGALASLPGKTAVALAERAHCDVSDLNAYIGAHIRGCCYETSDEILDRFIASFGEGCRSGERNLSLSHAVRTGLTDAGVDSARISELPECTSCTTDRFFSYRADGPVTGRHCAAALIF